MKVETFDVEIPQFNYGRNKDGDWCATPKESIMARVEVTVDTLRLAHKLAPKAINTKKRQSVEAGGLIVVKILSSKQKEMA